MKKQYNQASRMSQVDPYDTIQQQAERIRELDAKNHFLGIACDDYQAQLDSERQQLAEVVEYAGKLREVLKEISSPTQTESLLWWQIKARNADALPLPKAMQDKA